MGGWYAANSNLINTIGLNAILALSIYVMLACGQLSLASPAYMAVGAYTAALLTTDTGIGFPIQIALGTLLAGVVAFLLGLPLLRLRGVYLAICTVGFVQVVQIFFTTWTPGGGGEGIAGILSVTTTWQIYLALALLCFLFWRLEGSALGRGFAAIRQDEAAARSLGIDTVAYKLGAFAVSGMLAGLAGVLSARLHYFIQPSDFSFDLGLNALIYVVVGGSFTFIGSPLGALLLTALPEVLRPLQGVNNGARAIGEGVILLLVILFLPGGLVDAPGRLRSFVLSGRGGQRRAGDLSALPENGETA